MKLACQFCTFQQRLLYLGRVYFFRSPTTHFLFSLSKKTFSAHQRPACRMENKQQIRIELGLLRTGWRVVGERFGDIVDLLTALKPRYGLIYSIRNDFEAKIMGMNNQTDANESSTCLGPTSPEPTLPTKVFGHANDATSRNTYIYGHFWLSCTYHTRWLRESRGTNQPFYLHGQWCISYGK